jgi:hypothetical protein
MESIDNSRDAGRAQALRCRAAVTMLAMLLGGGARPAAAQGLQVAGTSFPVTATNQNVQQTVTLTVGADDVVINSIGTVPPYYNYSLNNGCTMFSDLPAGTVCTMTISFQPRHPGYASAPVPISSSAGLQIVYVDQVTGQPQTQTFPLTGSGTYPSGVLSPGLITDIVGNDVTFQAGYGGDGGPASGALFVTPSAVTMDSYGNLYIADTGNNVVRAVYLGGGQLINVANPQYGNIYTIAGIGPSGGISSAGPGTDGVLATSSHLNAPGALAFDTFGNLYISDSGNQAVRIVYAQTGVIQTVAGTLNNVETPGTGFSGDGGAATAAQLYVPAGIAVDGYGNLFIADSGNNAIRVVYKGGTIPNLTGAVVGNIYTVVGGPGNPGIANNGDGGLATAADLNFPTSVTVDSSGDIYVADQGNFAVRWVDAVSGNISSVYHGTDSPVTLSVDASDDIYFTLHSSCTVAQYNPTTQANPATPVTMVVAGNGTCTASGDSGAATQAGLKGALGLVVDGSGNIDVLEADGVRNIAPTQSTLNFGSVDVGTNSAAQSELLTDEDIIPQLNTNNYQLLQPTYFNIVGQGYGYVGPPPFTTVAFASSNPNIADCNAVLNGSSYPNLTLKPGQSCGASFIFQPYAEGASVPASTSGAGYIQLVGTGIGPLPTATLTGTPANFVSVVSESSSAPQTFTLTNTSNINLALSAIYFTPGGIFYETDTCGISPQVVAIPTLAPGASCQITVTFLATTTGPVSATLNVMDNASSGSGTQSLSLTGTGTAPLGVFSPTEVIFSNVAPGTIGMQTVTFSNTGTATLHYNPSSWTITGYDPARFAISSNNCTGTTLAVGASCSLTLSFTPLTWAYYSTNLNVQDDSGGVRIVQGTYLDVTQSVHMVGATGNPPLATNITAGNTVFPATAVGSSATQIVTLTLSGAAALKSVIMTAGFSEYSVGAITGCVVDGTTVNTAGTVCQVSITFTPSGPGNRNAPLSVVDVEGGATVPYTFGLTGSGTGPLAVLTPGIITTVVGSAFGYGDGIVGADGAAVNAAVGFTGGMAMDAAGEMFLADTQNAVIWKTDTSGNIHLFAGTPFPPGGYTQALSGDGGTALGAQLSYVSPMPLALDTRGGLYIGDNSGQNYNQNSELRYVDPATNLITDAVGFVAPGSWSAGAAVGLTARIQVTLAGVKYLFVAIVPGVSGSAPPTWPTGTGVNVYDGTVEWQNQGVYFGGPGCAAQTDAWGDGCLASQAPVSTVAGMVVDQSGNLYFSDTGVVFSNTNPTTTTYHSLIRRVDAVTKIVTAIVGNGVYGYSPDGTPANQAKLSALALAFDNNGNLYFVDYGGLVLRMLNSSTGTISTIAGLTSYSFPNETTYCIAGYGDGGPATAAGFAYISDVQIDAANNIYLVDQYGCHVRRIDAGTQIIHNVAGMPGNYNYINSGYGDLNQPHSNGSDGDATLATLNEPGFVRLDAQGDMYIASAFGGVRKVDVTQSVLNFSGSNQTTFADVTQQLDTASTAQTATVLNAGNNGLVFFANPFLSPSWGISSTDFTRDVTNPTGTPDCYDVGSIGIGYECPVNVDFTPMSASGWLTGVDTVNDNVVAHSGAQPIALIGNAGGPAPLVTLLPFLLSFSTPQGSTSPGQILTLTNNDVNPLPISSITITGSGAPAFAQTNNCGTVLAANSSCLITVTFSPPIVGGNYVAAPPPDILTATVSVTDTAGNSPQTAQLTGRGTLPAAQQPTSLPADAEIIHVTDTISLVPTTILNVAETIRLTDAPGLVKVGPTQVAPTITWANPASITYGTALSATQLNATASVAGTFSYNPVAGTVLPEGSYGLSVTFTPTDTADYTTVTVYVQLMVNQATPTVSWNTPASITYGTALNATQLNATASVAGTFNYNPSTGAVLTAGVHTLNVTFVPTDQADYAQVTSTVQIDVNKATPVITWANPATITYGTPLSTTQLNATTTVAGTFSYNPTAGTVLTEGSYGLAATFTPTDTTDYTTTTVYAQLSVKQATPTVTWSTPAAITYGTALSATQLNATASVAGTFNYNPSAGTVLTVGPHTLSVTFIPTDQSDYTQVTATVPITVNQVPLTITWATPAAITYGTALSATQLVATASIPGTFSYNPAAGVVLPVGNQTLGVTFTPTDTADYSITTKSMQILVNQAPLSVVVANATRSYGAANPAFTSTVTGIVNHDVLTVAYSTTAVQTSSPGNYSIVPSVTGASVADYAFTGTNGTLTISQAPSTTALVLSSGLVQAGSPVTFTATVASTTTGIPTGVVNFYDGTVLLGPATVNIAGQAVYSTSALGVSTHTITAVYGGDADFLPSTSSASTEIVADFNFAFTVGSQTVLTGHTAVYELVITPSDGSLLDPVTFTVSGLPAGATYTFSPASLPAGSGTTTVTLSIQVPTTLAEHKSRPFGVSPVAYGLLLLPLFALSRNARRRRRFVHLVFLIVFSLGLAVSVSGCGGGFYAQQTYNLTVTATSGSLSHSIQAGLIVE